MAMCDRGRIVMVFDLSLETKVLQARRYFPLICMAQEPQTAALQDDRKARELSNRSWI